MSLFIDMLSVVMLNVTFYWYAECRVFIVMLCATFYWYAECRVFIGMLCVAFLLVCWVSLCWVSWFHWVQKLTKSTMLTFDFFQFNFNLKIHLHVRFVSAVLQCVFSPLKICVWWDQGQAVDTKNALHNRTCQWCLCQILFSFKNAKFWTDKVEFTGR
jgi:hypothetical protein